MKSRFLYERLKRLKKKKNQRPLYVNDEDPLGALLMSIIAILIGACLVVTWHAFFKPMM